MLLLLVIVAPPQGPGERGRSEIGSEIMRSSPPNECEQNPSDKRRIHVSAAEGWGAGHTLSHWLFFVLLWIVLPRATPTHCSSGGRQLASIVRVELSRVDLAQLLSPGV